ncbi:succinylglutamate desuccinylase/aspartoacylase family protein [Hoeflea sp. BAL378]|uniref:succinylglutamate desuccinylase/aspartoacylase domain-containing protein n=1 Tax=Hoeflea sp. BAL378 TaxID=1547437 RepID=UPI000554A420|nr:succinylglutamate desuccinylase/aspartoacylase family protein [Hoeflea sp. BAL378]
MLQDTFEFSSSFAGPRLAVTILMHGDEACGLAVLDTVRAENFALSSGSLVVLVLNRRAHEAPEGPVRHLGTDMNRIWSHAGLGERTEEARRVASTLPCLKDADAILDIHSMPSQDTPFLFVSETHPRSADLAEKLGAAVPRVVTAPPPQQRGMALFETELLSKETPIVVECGQHQSAQAPDVARATFLRFLSVHGMIETGGDAETASSETVRFYEMCREIKLDQGPLTLALPMRGFDRLDRGETYGWDGPRPLIAEEDCHVLLTRPAVNPGDEALTLVRLTRTRHV